MVVHLIAVTCTYSTCLLVGAIEDAVLGGTFASFEALPEGEHLLSPVALHLEVTFWKGLFFALEWLKPHRLSSIVDDHPAILRGAVLPGAGFGSDEDVAGSGIVRPGDHINGRRVEVRARAEAPHICP